MSITVVTQEKDDRQHPDGRRFHRCSPSLNLDARCNLMLTVGKQGDASASDTPHSPGETTAWRKPSQRSRALLAGIHYQQ